MFTVYEGATETGTFGHDEDCAVEDDGRVGCGWVEWLSWRGVAFM